MRIISSVILTNMPVLPISFLVSTLINQNEFIHLYYTNFPIIPIKIVNPDCRLYSPPMIDGNDFVVQLSDLHSLEVINTTDMYPNTPPTETNGSSRVKSVFCTQ